MKSNQNGFSVVEIIMAIVIVGLIGAVGWMFWQNVIKTSNTDSTPSYEKVNQPPDDEIPSTPKYQTYTDSKYKFTFHYPTGWSDGISTCLASCPEYGFSLRAPDFKLGSPDGGHYAEGAYMNISRMTYLKGAASTYDEIKATAKSMVAGKSYTYNYDFADTTMADRPAFTYRSTTTDHNPASETVTLYTTDKSNVIWQIYATDSAVHTTSDYDGPKALDLIKSTWKW